MRYVEATATTVLLLLIAAPATTSDADAPADRYWPQWRGPDATGVGPGADPPMRWSESQNVAWKIEVPGTGKGSPAVWGERVYLMTAITASEVSDPPALTSRHPAVSAPSHLQRFAVLAIERASGAVAWQTVVREELPHEGTHRDGSFASASPVVDGERIYASFGSRGLYALDLSGRVLWEKDLGDMTVRLGFGEGSSPALWGDTLLQLWDHEGPSFLVALDAASGEERWRAPRAEQTSWTTPLVVERDGRAQVITAATGAVRSYDPSSGKLLWESAGMTLNAIPSPVFDGKLLFLTSGFRGNVLQALELDGGEAAPRLVWSFDRDTPYVPSPLLYDGVLYLLKSNSAILSAFDAQTGERHYLERLPDMTNVYASPVAAAGRVYVVGRDGVTTVLAHGPKLELLATNRLDEGFDASPALVGGELYLRGDRHLYRISSE